MYKKWYNKIYGDQKLCNFIDFVLFWRSLQRNISWWFEKCNNNNNNNKVVMAWHVLYETYINTTKKMKCKFQIDLNHLNYMDLSL